MSIVAPRISKGAVSRKFSTISFSVGLFMILIEIALLIFIWAGSGNWLYQATSNKNSTLFKHHPYLNGGNKEDVSLTFNGKTISHNSSGFRGSGFDQDTTKELIACIGGSTTYGVGVNNNETWPYFLDSLLGDETQVINLGIPGHSTVEHIILASFYLRSIKPDRVIIHAGINDLRNSHVRPLLNDYSAFHAPTVYGSLGLCPLEKLPKLAVVRTVVRLMQKADWYPTCFAHTTNYQGQSSEELDVEVMTVYQDNLTYLIGLLKMQEIEVIMLPQVLSKDNFFDNNYQWWAPYLPDKTIKKTSDAFNNVMLSVANSDSVQYIHEAVKREWRTAEFSDPSHLNAEGNLLLAEIIATAIK